MHPARTAKLLWAALGLGWLCVVPLAAQNRLYVLESDGKYYPVVKVAGTRPFINVQGKLTPAQGERFALRKVEEYLPLYIEVTEKAAGTNYAVPLASGSMGTIEINHEFHFNARFESAYPVEDAFLLLELVGANVDKPYFFVHEIGRLEPREPTPVRVDLNLQQKLGAGRFRLHVFAAGSEVFSSEMPAPELEAALDRMVAKRITGVNQANPSPFFGAPPKLPATLRGSGANGRAVLTLTLSPRGTVVEARVESATQPALGDAALAAARQWRFLPKVEDGRAVGITISLPVDFGAL